ncbi:hypothetical protein ARTHRO9AX_80386 [Arthrobacter sp. 9AX]|nr:hypothetical protein ARTHRO9AX_80386 [Arthrobacter sp. 9AX]
MAKDPAGRGGSGSPSGRPESTKPSHRCLMPRIWAARSISRRRAPAMSRRGCGSPSTAGFWMSPRDPSVQVATMTSTPEAAYFAMVAAPLLDSSSGWAWTASSRSGAWELLDAVIEGLLLYSSYLGLWLLFVSLGGRWTPAGAAGRESAGGRALNWSGDFPGPAGPIRAREH